MLAAVVRRYGHFDAAEDATQEALLAAAVQWPGDGPPDDPKAWLIRVAARRLTDILRSEQARRSREARALPEAPEGTQGSDDTLILLFLACHPSLPVASQIGLTLRAVGGLTTAEIARAFLVPEATMTRRITRAKQRVKDSGVPFALPVDQPSRLAAVLHVLYLVFTEGYATTAGPALHRVELTAEAIRLTRLLHGLRPDDSEVGGLLALMLLTDARRPARTAPDGSLVPMSEQDRSRWDAGLVAEGTALLTAALRGGPVGPYQVQAAIAALHDEAPSADATDWPQIVALYEVLLRLADNPVVALNHAVAVAMVHGPDAGLRRLEHLVDEKRLAPDHRVAAVRGHLLERAGDPAGARAAYEEAASRTASVPRQRYLRARAAGL